MYMQHIHNIIVLYVYNMTCRPESQVLLGFLSPERVLALCPRAVAHVWPLVYTRAVNLYPTIDPL